MKQYCLALCTLIFIIGFNAYARQKPIPIVLDTYPPYTNEMADNSGVLGELLRKSFAAQELDTTIEFQLWSDIEENLSYGQFLTVFWTTNRILRRNHFFSDPILYVDNQLVAVKPISRTYQNLGQFKESKIGITKGFSYGKTFEAFKPDLTLVEFDTRFTGLRALINNEVDYLLIDPLVAKQLMASYFKYRTKKKLYYLDDLKFEAQPAYLVCSKNYANCQGILKQFERGLQQLKGNKEYNKILSF